MNSLPGRDGLGWLFRGGFGDSRGVVAAPVHRKDLLTSLLREVSRSFYLTLRVLPAGVRSQISLAYLLARATDTLADTDVVPVEERLTALERLRDRILGESRVPLDFSAIIQAASAPSVKAAAVGERRLLGRIEEALDVLDSFPADDRQSIRRVLDTITSGQELDLRRFEMGTIAPTHPQALRTAAELDDYTYRVAGCVGEFWTEVCRRRLFPTVELDDAWLLEHGIAFGKGLQRVNILRDMPADLRRGRCYLPTEALQAAGLTPTDLLDAANGGRLRPVYLQEWQRAEAQLAAGWAYTRALPQGQFRVRLACAWPVLIGVRTLSLLHGANPLAATRVKVSRREVRQILLGTLLRSAWPGGWEGLYQRWSRVPSRPVT